MGRTMLTFFAITILSFSIFFFSEFSLPASAEIKLTPDSVRTDTIYGGEEYLIEGAVFNANKICDIETCACTPPSPYIQNCSIEIPIKDGEFGKYNIILKAPQFGPGLADISLKLSCDDQKSFIRLPCMGLSNEAPLTIQMLWSWCGDSKCNAGKEDCKTCPTDCRKCEGEICEKDLECEGGYCVHYRCSSKPFKESDGYCDRDKQEICTATNLDCCEAAENSTAQKINEIKDRVEGKAKELPLKAIGIISGGIILLIVIFYIIGRTAKKSK